ncbi:MAG TPA: sigma-54 dependent transcriptional regulator [Gemmatimonadaceae bacterium]|nr:sigma-54 dependent transcriptional regulator [Gemmatimonadaceae bacterium]
MSYETIVPPSRSYNSSSATAVADEPEARTQDDVQDGGGVPRELRASIRILVIDDDRTLREGCSSVLQVEGYNVTSCGRGDEAIEMVRRANYDIVLVDLYMTPVPGMEILKAILAARPESIVVMMTGNPSVNSSVEALRVGAWDYLPKPFSGAHLQVLIGRAAHAVKAARERDTARSSMLADNGNSDKMTLLGASPSFRQIVELARKVASTDASVMLVGESGTGKELIAQFVHRHSRRAKLPLVPLNCAAVPENLLESEMFGHKRGSFTGADRDKVGLLEVANNGTFFLDELTEMPLTLQAKLLRVVQDGVLRRVGSETQDAVVNVRFISATNRDPREAIKQKHLREDLFYRLNVFPIVLPPLRERVEDIPILARHFLEQSWKRHHSARAALPQFSDSAMDMLQGHHWRGNVRELQNVVEHCAVLASAGSLIAPHEIVLHNDAPFGGDAVGSPVVLNDAYHLAKEQVLAKFEKDYVTRLVARASGNMSRAARLASVDRTTLYRLLERHGFRRETNENPIA